MARENHSNLKFTSLFSRSRGSIENGGFQAETLIENNTECKSCCGLAASQTVSIRWFIVMIAFVGICCSVVGTVLIGAMKARGREHLTVSIFFQIAPKRQIIIKKFSLSLILVTSMATNGRCGPMPLNALTSAAPHGRVFFTRWRALNRQKNLGLHLSNIFSTSL